ncbi:MAG: peptide chain release factor N(5)-glutamine methyltransferase [Marmoricola sp.]
MTDARTLLRAAEERLAAGGVASPEHDAGALLAFVTGTQRALVSTVDITADQASDFEALVERRAAREPLQHLTGEAHFRYIELAVGPGVFVPRPETELLAGWAIDEASRIQAAGRVPIVVDLCTGSGAIAKSIAHEVPTAVVHAIELDEAAYSWAERNLADTGVRLVRGDLASAFPDLDGTVDVVVCNPPYIPLEAWESVAREARDHDPHLALFSGQDGLDAMRALEATASRLLVSGGVVGAEHADAQGESAPAVFTAAGRWTDVRDHPDLNRRPRFLTARLAR